MKIKEGTDNFKFWLYCLNEDVTEYSIYKLHVALNISNFYDHHARIYSFLKEAVENGIIPQFKMLNSTMFEDIDGNARLFNNPFIIYLTKNFDPQKIAMFCQQLESKLRDLPKNNRDYLSMADLELTDHITFRQASLRGKYIGIESATKKQLLDLNAESMQSPEYKNLQESLRKLASEKEIRAQARENLLTELQAEINRLLEEKSRHINLLFNHECSIKIKALSELIIMIRSIGISDPICEDFIISEQFRILTAPQNNPTRDLLYQIRDNKNIDIGLAPPSECALLLSQPTL
jgi:hypothetical protein